MKIDNNATIIDVRTPEEFSEEHVLGAINIPLDQLAGRMEELKNLPRPIITYCRVGNRSGIAVEIIKQHGIMEAMNGGGLVDMLLAKKII